MMPGPTDTLQHAQSVRLTHYHPQPSPHSIDDGTETPFCIAIDKRQLDRTLTTGRGVLTVWVPTGKTLELPLEICV